ncbi:kinetoplast DNA-associated [Micractinium conductrix]|uniref:Kinetoplast DNA-associated n=1 Tax=Micractinium conductrix TaxID=554055 RepID=A0A2P6V4N4_9CHLO|nr:kinetoplast DNA-associated [Micractinium conductrix]|eukprot:PSC69037.1 kinetoplast DNA-associated [Micractinium conductrix]
MACIAGGAAALPPGNLVKAFKLLVRHTILYFETMPEELALAKAAATAVVKTMCAVLPLEVDDGMQAERKDSWRREEEEGCPPSPPAAVSDEDLSRKLASRVCAALRTPAGAAFVGKLAGARLGFMATLAQYGPLTQVYMLLAALDTHGCPSPPILALSNALLTKAGPTAASNACEYVGGVLAALGVAQEALEAEVAAGEPNWHKLAAGMRGDVQELVIDLDEPGPLAPGKTDIVNHASSALEKAALRCPALPKLMRWHTFVKGKAKKRVAAARLSKHDSWLKLRKERHVKVRTQAGQLRSVRAQAAAKVAAKQAAGGQERAAAAAAAERQRAAVAAAAADEGDEQAVAEEERAAVVADAQAERAAAAAAQQATKQARVAAAAAAAAVDEAAKLAAAEQARAAAAAAERERAAAVAAAAEEEAAQVAAAEQERAAAAAAVDEAAKLAAAEQARAAAAAAERERAAAAAAAAAEEEEAAKLAAAEQARGAAAAAERERAAAVAAAAEEEAAQVAAAEQARAAAAAAVEEAAKLAAQACKRQVETAVAAAALRKEQDHAAEVCKAAAAAAAAWTAAEDELQLADAEAEMADAAKTERMVVAEEAAGPPAAAVAEQQTAGGDHTQRTPARGTSQRKQRTPAQRTPADSVGTARATPRSVQFTFVSGALSRTPCPDTGTSRKRKSGGPGSVNRARNAKAAANIPMHKITNWYKPAPWYQLENQERSLEECSQLQSSSAAAKAAKELVFGDGEVAGPAAEAAAAELEAELAGGQQATTAACGSAVKRTRRR